MTEQPIIVLKCDVCGELVSELRRDDADTQWYRCPNGHEISTPIKKLYKPNTYTTFESWCDPETKTFNPALLANDIVQNFEIKTDMRSDVLYFYDAEKGIYDKNGDMILRGIINSLLQQKNRQHRTTETIFLCHSKTHSKIDFSKKIAVENGLLDVKIGELTPFTPNEFVTVQIPVHYDQNANCPATKKFLNEVLEPDQIPIIQEFFGYCLLQEYPIHTCAVLLGEGANGKSTLLNLFTVFLGPENCSHATLQQLCEGKFELAQLYGKLANICDDLPGDALKSVGNFKNLTGNAPIMAQFKHKNPFDFLNTAKLLWACNRLPAASEDTIAYYRRFIILNFNKLFIGDKADTQILKKLTTPQELSGLLNYALEGLKRLLEKQQLSHSQSIEETRAQYIRTADSCQAFIEEMIELDTNPNAIITDEVFYQNYVSYCNTHKLPIRKKAQLTISMQKNCPEAKHTNQRIHGKVTRAWQYVKFQHVASVASVVAPLLFSEILESQIIIKRGEVTTPTTVTTCSYIGQRTCGQCDLWHKGSCCFPGDPSYVAPTNPFAQDCRSFTVNGKTETERKIHPHAEKNIVSVYEFLRNNLKEAFYQQKAVDLLVQQCNYSMEEAEKVFQMFVDEGKIFRDAYGLWSFV